MGRITLVGGLLFLSATVNVAQAYRIYRLTSVAAMLKQEERLQVGAEVGPIVLLDAEGRRTEVPVVDARPLIIYWMSPQCAWCSRNEANIRALVHAVRGRYRIVVLTVKARSVRGFDAVQRLGVPVAGEPDAATLRQYRFGGTPQTIVVSTSGTISRVWTGAYLARLESEIEQYFAVNLPGVEPASAQPGNIADEPER